MLIQPSVILHLIEFVEEKMLKSLTMKTIFLGNYWQTSSKEKEPIEWIILKEETAKMYIISKYCLDCVPYTESSKIAWKNSYIRNWLNSYFLNTAFSAEQQEKIISAKIKTSNGVFLDEGTSTQDKIFLPSVSEAKWYFGSTGLYDIYSKQKRIARPTRYAAEQGSWVYGLEYGPITDSVLKECLLKDASLTNGRVNPNIYVWKRDGKKQGKLEKDTDNKKFASRWYLRSSGNDIVTVEECGEITYIDKKFMDTECHKHISVRPAMWVKK